MRDEDTSNNNNNDDNNNNNSSSSTTTTTTSNNNNNNNNNEINKYNIKLVASSQQNVSFTLVAHVWLKRKTDQHVLLVGGT